MATPRYAARFGRLPAVFEVLLAHPNGVPLATLADEIGVPAGELREDLLAFYTADPLEADRMLGLWRPPVLEFLGPDGDGDVDPLDAEVVRAVNDRPTEELGVEYVDASELALVHTAAVALHDVEPDPDLAAAIDVLTETMVGAPGGHPERPAWHEPLRPLQEAQRQRRAVRIVYSRTWQHGVTPRVIHPYRLVQTRRGWEVDAGPPDSAGRLRTFLLSGIREVESLEQDFELPADLPAMLEAQRATTPVRVVLPHGSRWAADMYAETVTVLSADEDDVALELELLPPLADRVGMLLLAAGSGAFVTEPAELASAGAVLAEELLVHHGTR
ncbi:WYL domain-containing protein [Nocardioides humilatus]|uniref:WYL domain-containing protein n=1 Tax=Nocardioides humilatus TaxID=2607660 RepID=A0A5B1LGR1_9ACTN|nr:WYL domain-containing protein [Nocardioides humilatus]KAA1418849.1 WYL domain-containing protein [Nocardioides humilatus]